MICDRSDPSDPTDWTDDPTDQSDPTDHPSDRSDPADQTDDPTDQFDPMDNVYAAMTNDLERLEYRMALLIHSRHFNWREGDQMTQLLEQAFAEVSKLPASEQDSIADWLLNEIASESRWSHTFAGSQDVLSMLAADALAEHRRGETQELDPECL